MHIGPFPRTVISSAISLMLLELTSASALAQTAPASTPASDSSAVTAVYVTAQRKPQLLQEVPISVTALSGDDLAARQISNALDLQLSIPNVSFSRTQFGSSFTIRGVGDLCVGTSCDQATGIHVNEMPIMQSRIADTELFDMQRVEVLRGPQGTLYGRNATAGVVNFITARPTFDKLQGNVQLEAGSYDNKRVTGMVNVPISDTVAARFAGSKLKRDGYTENLFNNSSIDGRDLYSVRASLRIKPSHSTTIDLMGSHFSENDDRSRFTKQMCSRDNTGVLGCRPDSLAYEAPNFNGTFSGVLSSREFFGVASGGNPMIMSTALSSVYGADAIYGGAATPANMRQVSSDFSPTYVAKNSQFIARLEQDLGDNYGLTVIAGFVRDRTNQTADFNLIASNPLTSNPGLLTFAGLAAAPGAAFPGGVNPFTPAAKALFPNGVAQGVCTSAPNRQYTGVFGGYVSGCGARGAEFETSRDKSRQRTVEAHIDSKLDGPLNFLVGGIYLDYKRDGDYFVNVFPGDYVSGVLGGATALAQRSAGNAAYPNVFIAPSFYNGEAPSTKLQSYGLFGEVYYDVSAKVKLTGGLRYSSDDKRQVQRVVVEAFPTPFGVTDAFQSPFASSFDADASLPGNQAYADKRVKSSAVTGRVVAEYHPEKDSLLYASYSRGYKSGGINPPTRPEFALASTFKKEVLDAFELGAKNSFLGGRVSTSANVFAYSYKDLQISRLLARATLNDNADASVYGAEFESFFMPTRHLKFNLSAGILKSKVKDLSIIDPRDPSGGRSDVVVVKDLTTAANCVVSPAVAGNVAGTNGFVTAVNAQLGLRAPVALPGTNATGAFGVCSALQAAGGGQYIVSNGVEMGVGGNQLPLSPRAKLSIGAEYTIELPNGMSLVPRADAHYTGKSYSSVFNKEVDRVKGYAYMNAQVQLTSQDKMWYLKAFVQNISSTSATTGRFVADQSAGLVTSIFTVEPRRYGAVVGYKF